jgi:ferredoxin-NADP reductase
MSEADSSPRTVPLIDMRLIAITFAAELTNVFEFRPVSGAAVATFESGAHIDLHLPTGLIRQYSLLNSQDETHRYVVAVKRDPNSRGGSSYLHEKLTVGTVLKVGAPRNNFRLTEGVPHTVLVAGGIGITPIWSMLQRLENTGANWELHYATRKRGEAAFAAELAQFGPRVHLHVDDECGGRVMDLGAIVSTLPQSAHLYCCGPTPMLASFEAATRSRPESHVHIERFTASPPVAGARAYVVELARSGKSVRVAEGQTILEALRASGYDAPSSCEQGICGACETRVVSGTPDHRDMILSPQERAANRTMMICCSGCQGDVLVLDL